MPPSHSHSLSTTSSITIVSQTTASGTNGSSGRDAEKRRGKESKSGWFHQVKDWVTTSEPSLNALKQHRKETFQRAGIALDDPQAGPKLHAPLGVIPESAIKPAGSGPDPEEVVLRKVQQRRKMSEAAAGPGQPLSEGGSRTSHSSSGRSVGSNALLDASASVTTGSDGPAARGYSNFPFDG